MHLKVTSIVLALCSLGLCSLARAGAPEEKEQMNGVNLSSEFSWLEGDCSDFLYNAVYLSVDDNVYKTQGNGKPATETTKQVFFFLGHWTECTGMKATHMYIEDPWNYGDSEAAVSISVDTKKLDTGSVTRTGPALLTTESCDIFFNPDIDQYDWSCTTVSSEFKNITVKATLTGVGLTYSSHGNRMFSSREGIRFHDRYYATVRDATITTFEVSTEDGSPVVVIPLDYLLDPVSSLIKAKSGELSNF